MDYDLLLYFFYRIVQAFVEIFQDTILNFWARVTKTSDRKAEIFHVLYRKMRYDRSQKYDFIGIHSRFSPTTDFLLDPHWSLYTLCEKFAYFVEMPLEINEYHARNAPFLYMKQFEITKRIARISLEEFLNLADNAHHKNPMGKVVFFTNIPRSGSTLVTQMVQVDEKKLVAFGEPDAFTFLPIMQEEGKWTGEYLQNLLRATFRIYCKNQNPDQTYVLKTQSNGVKLVGEIKKIFPKIPHIFQYRENILKATISMEKLFQQSFSAMEFLFKHFPKFADFLIGTSRFEAEGIRKTKPKNALEIAFVIAVNPYRFYAKFRHCFALPMVTYEALTDKETASDTLKKIFDVCGLPEELIPEGLSALDRDSQAGTALSKDAMKQFVAATLSHEKIDRLKVIAEQLDFPVEMVH